MGCLIWIYAFVDLTIFTLSVLSVNVMAVSHENYHG